MHDDPLQHIHAINLTAFGFDSNILHLLADAQTQGDLRAEIVGIENTAKGADNLAVFLCLTQTRCLINTHCAAFKIDHCMRPVFMDTHGI